MDIRLRHTLTDRLKVLVPFGLGQTKPPHFRDMLKAAWDNRDELAYAWQVISQGVCDGCALGVAGLHDWTIDGIHLCMTRLNLLRLNTMPAMDVSVLRDLSRLRSVSNRELRQLGRLPFPMLRRRGARGFDRISWDEATALVAGSIRSSDPGRLAFYLTSRGITNEVYYVAQKVARFLGTNNIDNAARLCHSPSTGAMKAAIGHAASTCSYRDWFGTDLIVFFGSNPANDQPVAMKYLVQAKRQGTKVALVNPMLEPGMRRYHVPSDPLSAVFGSNICDYWVPVRVGGDVALIYGVLKTLMDRGAWDRQWIDRHTTGFDELRAACQRVAWDDVERGSGVSRAGIEQFATLLQNAPNAVFVWSMGITQHAFGGDAVAMILNLGLLRGYIGRPKTGLMPIRGHSGVQGGAEMGAYATAFPGGVAINPESAAALSREYGFPVPDAPGLSACEMIEAAHAGQLDLLYCIGGNFLRTLPEPGYVAQALARVPLRVHQDIIVTDQMLIDGSGDVLLLPAKTRYEQDGGGTQTTTERRVCFSPEIPRQVGQARAEWRILRDMAVAAKPEFAHLLGCESGHQIRAEIARIVPFYRGIERLLKTGDSFQYGGERLCDGGVFNTPEGKARFRAVEIPPTEHDPGLFRCATRRGKQFNTLIFADVDPLTGAPRDAILMNPDDAARLHLRTGDRATLVNDIGQFAGRVMLAPVAPGSLHVHWPEANVIIPRGIRDRIGGVPDYNCTVRIVPGWPMRADPTGADPTRGGPVRADPADPAPRVGARQPDRR